MVSRNGSRVRLQPRRTRSDKNLVTTRITLTSLDERINIDFVPVSLFFLECIQVGYVAARSWAYLRLVL